PGGPHHDHPDLVRAHRGRALPGRPQGPLTGMSGSRAKVVSLRKLQTLRHLWGFEGKTVVFTNGVFAILHARHVMLREGARAHGDALIVGLNSDASVRRLGKGPERPINRWEDRAAVLAGLACVDAVVGFSEDTPEELLSKLKPDVLVKGGDYKLG